MKSYGEILSKYIKEKNISLAEIARRLKDEGVNIDRSYVSKFRSGALPPPSDEVTVALAKVLEVDPTILLWAATIEKSHPELKRTLMKVDTALMKRGIELEKKYPISDDMDEIEVDKYISSIPEYSKFYDDLVDDLIAKEEKSEYKLDIIPVGNQIKIPIIGTVAAGTNGLAYEEYLGEEWIDEDFVRGGRHFYLKVKGDSMIGDGILAGDLALVKETPDVEYGELAVVIVNGEEGTIKRVYKKEGSVVLQSSNPSYPPRVFTGSEVNEIRIVGKVKQTIRKY